jgi:4-hydroxybenzoate polyprenyltransferase
MGAATHATLTERAAVALRLGRVSNLPTVWTNALAGAVLAGGDLHTAVLAPLLLGVSATYAGGMYLNDAFDRDVDARERPERPIPSGQVSAAAVFAAGTALLAVGAALTTAAALVAPDGAPLAAAIVAAALACSVVLYDVVHKRTRAAVLAMASCRALLYPLAAFATAGRFAVPIAATMAAMFVYVTGLTAVAADENRPGLRNVRAVALLAPAGAVAVWMGRTEPLGVVLALGFCAWTWLAVRHLNAPHADVRSAVTKLIAGMCLFDAALIAGCGRPALAVAAAASTWLTRSLQRHVPGT